MKAKTTKAKGLRFCAKCWRAIPKGRVCEIMKMVSGERTFCAACSEKRK